LPTHSFFQNGNLPGVFTAREILPEAISDALDRFIANHERVLQYAGESRLVAISIGGKSFGAYRRANCFAGAAQSAFAANAIVASIFQMPNLIGDQAAGASIGARHIEENAPGVRNAQHRYRIGM
jgi:hypothetical protein